MALKTRTADDALAQREDAEREIERAATTGLRHFLGLIRKESVEAARANALTAAASDDYPTLGASYGWWVDTVDNSLLPAIREQLHVSWHATATGQISSASIDASEEFMGRVRDRLVRGLEPPVADDAFEAVRVSVAQATAQGWSRQELAARLAAELSWETDAAYWRKQQALADKGIDAILDPLGPPGHPTREHARLNDPRVRELQTDRTRAIRYLDAERSYWQTRAMRIARTESTAAANYGALNALHQEGVRTKEWLAANGPRTRPEHAEASGQIVALDAPFEVGGYNMMMPGDPSAPPHLTVNCRCTVLGADD